MEEAVASAKKAFVDWRETTVPSRCRIMFRFRDLIEKHTVYIYLHPLVFFLFLI